MDPVQDESLVSDEPVIDEALVETPEPVVEETPAVVEEKPAPTMDDTIRAKFRELNTPVPGPDEKPPEGQMRDPVTGRFVDKPKAPAQKSAPAAVAKPPLGKTADGVQPVAPAVAKAGSAPAPELEKAPTSWKAGAQVKYAALDPEVKAMVHQREADFHKGLEGYKAFANIGQQFHAEFQPYEAMIRASGHTPQSLVKNWMNTEYRLKTASVDEKAEMFLNYAKAYGVTPEKITEVMAKVAAGQPVTPPVDPRVASLEDKLLQVTSHIENANKEAATREYKVIEAETLAFGQKPENKHFNAVRLDMAALMESGRATSLQDAYDKAIWANTETRAILQAEQLADARAKAAEKAAAARKAAGANVATRGTLPAKPAAAGSGTIDDTLRATYRAIQARGGAAA